MLETLYMEFPEIKMYFLVFFLVFFQKHKKVMATINAVLTIGIGLLLIKTIPCTIVKSKISILVFLLVFLVFFYFVILDLITLVFSELPKDFNALSLILIITQILSLFILVFSTWNIISKGKHTEQAFQVYMKSFEILSPILCVFVFLLYLGYCKRTLQIGLGSKSNKSIPLFCEMVCRTVLIAFTAWFTLLVNSNPKDLFSGTLTFISTFATFLYPMLDMYKFTRTKLDEYEKEKNFEAVRKRQEEIENESNGSKNYTA